MSELYALEVLEKAIEDTKKLFKPFDVKNWFKMIFLMLFVGGGISSFLNVLSNSFDFLEPFIINNPYTAGTTTIEGFSNGITGMITHLNPVFGVILSITLLVFLTWHIISNIMEFVFVKICEQKNIKILDNFKSNIINGFRLTGFKLIIAAIIVTIILMTISIIVPSLEEFEIFLVLLVLGLPIFIVVSLVLMFTRDFVIVRMVELEKTLTESLKDVLKMISEEWKQSIVYIMVKIVLGIAMGIISWIALIILLIPIFLIGGVLFLLTYLLYTELVVLSIVLGVISIIFVLVMIGIVIFSIQVPLMTFERYFSMRVYEKFSGTGFVEN